MLPSQEQKTRTSVTPYIALFFLLVAALILYVLWNDGYRIDNRLRPYNTNYPPQEL